jgi:putative two-component system response regulator
MARLLIIDNDNAVVTALSRLCDASGHSCETADSSESARGALGSAEYDLILVDLDMPGGTGPEVLDIAAADAPDVAIVILSAADEADRAAVLRKGTYGFVVKPFGDNEIEVAVFNALERRDLERERESLRRELQEKVSDRAIAVRQVSLELARARGSSTLAERETWQRLQAAVSLRDDETGKHIERVGLMVQRVTEHLSPPYVRARDLGMASVLHDVGKIGVPDLLLLKPGPLTPEERVIVQKHAEIGYRMLSDSRSAIVSLGAMIALSHHERWDGGGYPRGLAGPAIPIEARITSVVDAFDAMTHRRVYRMAWPIEEALEELTAQRGKQFDGDVVDALRDSMDDIVVVLDEHPDEEETRMRVLLVGGEQMFAEALINFLSGRKDILVVGTATTIEEATRATRQLRPEVVVLDSALPGNTAVETTSLIKAERPSTRIVWLTGSDDPATLSEAIQAGCAGYLQKGESLSGVVAAIHAVHAGESIVPREELPGLLQRVRPTRRGLGNTISDREREVLQLLAEGLTTEEIGERLVLSLHTVRNHIQRIIGKLHSHSRLEAVTTAVREGVIQMRVS